MEDLLILEKALEVANQRGCYTLQDSATIYNSLVAFKQKLSEKKEP